jgi:DNA-binding beta-propeller fold protein YncE
MRLLAPSLLFASVAVAALPRCGDAAELRQIGTISIPGEALDSFDISFVDPKTNRYFLADRSNKAIDIFDGRENRFIGRAEGFVGAVMKDGRVDNAHSGPNGVVTANGGTEIWAGDGDSTVKVINAKTMKIVDSISTGGKGRADEVGFDPKDQVFIVGNPADEPPFLTLISTKPGHKIIGKIVVERASDGIEQPQYYPGDGMFYVDVPELDKDKAKGALAVVDPKTAKLVKLLPVDNCVPHGLAIGPGSMMFLGCGAGNPRLGLPAQLVVFDAKQGKVAAAIAGVGGSDESSVNNKIGQYYSALAGNPGGSILAVIDAKTNMLAQKISTSGTAHSVAASEANNQVFVPMAKTGGPCGGCIVVFGPQ